MGTAVSCSQFQWWLTHTSANRVESVVLPCWGQGLLSHVPQTLVGRREGFLALPMLPQGRWEMGLLSQNHIFRPGSLTLHWHGWLFGATVELQDLFSQVLQLVGVRNNSSTLMTSSPTCPRCWEAWGGGFFLLPMVPQDRWGMGASLSCLQLWGWLTYLHKQSWLDCAALVRCRVCSLSVVISWLHTLSCRHPGVRQPMRSTGFTKKTDLTALKPAILFAQVLQGHRVGSPGSNWLSCSLWGLCMRSLPSLVLSGAAL